MRSNCARLALLWGLAPALFSAARPDERPWTILTAGLSEENVTKRMQAVSSLGVLGAAPKAVELAESALRDRDWGVRQAAAVALGEMKSRASIPTLKQALEDESPEVSFTAAKVLWDLGDRSGRELFLEALAGERRESAGIVRSTVRDAKSKLQNRSGLALLGLKHGAGFALGPFAMGIGVVEELLKDSSASTRALCATILAADSDPQSLEQLEGALADKNWAVRTAAAKALGLRSSPSSIPKLEPLLEDGKEAVRYMAAASIIRLAASKARGPGKAPRK